MDRMLKRGLVFLFIGLISFQAMAGILSMQSSRPIQVVKPIPVDLKIQNFKLAGAEELKVQFRYVNDKLKFIAFRNISKMPLEVKVFSNAYVLADGNELSIQSPNVQRIIIGIAPHVEQVGKTAELSDTSNAYLFSLQSDGYYALNATN